MLRGPLYFFNGLLAAIRQYFGQPITYTPVTQVADVDLFRTGGPQSVQGFSENLFRRGTRVEFAGQLLCRHRKKLAQSPERAGVGTPIVEDAEYSRGGDRDPVSRGLLPRQLPDDGLGQAYGRRPLHRAHLRE